MVAITKIENRVTTETSVTKIVRKVNYQVVHQTEERIRIRVSKLATDTDYANRLHWLVESLEFVSEVRISAPARSLIVNYESSGGLSIAPQSAIFACIQEASNPELSAELLPAKEAKEGREIEALAYVERVGLPLLSMVLSLLFMAGLPIPGWLIGAVIFAGSIPPFMRAWEGISEQKKLNVDFLDSLAISLHTLESRFLPSAFMLSLIESGEFIRDLTARGSERASLDLLDSLGKYAWVEREGQEPERILLKDVKEGDRVIVYPGDQIPVDGYILRGTGLIDQQKLTGESVPITRNEGDEVFASTLLVEGQLCIEVERTGNNTRAGVIVKLMQEAPVHDTRVENYARLLGDQAVLPTLLIGGGVFAATGNSARAIALITLDFGTGIRVSVPTAILSALTYAARNGVYIRSGRAIEILSRLDTVVFDKTGTLTQGKAGVVAIKTGNAGLDPMEVLSLAASAEQGLTHPVAEAIIRHAKESEVELYTCEEWDYRVGMGVVATINGQQMLVGSIRLMKQENIEIDQSIKEDPDIKCGANSMVYVAGDGKLLGVILYSDPPRPESAGVIQELHRQWIEPYMLSGDVKPVAEEIAAQLDIAPNNVYAEAFPERKVEVVKGLHDQGKTVAFVGDGINDSAALAYSSVSVSFAGATDIARETADVVLMEDDLRGLTLAIQIAKHTMDVVWQNTAIVAVPNFGALLAGIFVALDPVLAVVINNGSAILAEINGLRPLLGPGSSLPPSSSAKALEPAKRK
ncbi:MAG: heavy metal translocating P-type ATPase [Xenococcaceae cyanobacterium]